MPCKLTEQEVRELVMLAERDPAALPEAIRLKMNPSNATKLMEAWKGGLLSGPPTWGVNFASNALKQAMTLAETGIAGAIDPALAKLYGRERERFIGEVGATWVGAVSAMRGGALERLFTDLSAAATLKPEKVDVKELEERGGKADYMVGAIGEGYVPGVNAGRLFRAPFRILDATDRFFKDLAGESELWKLAHRKAKLEGKSGSALELRRRELVGRYRSEPDHQDVATWRDQITEARLDATFQKALSEENQGLLGELGAWVARNSRKRPWVALVFPFVRTPANIAYQTIERTPLGLKNALAGGKADDFAKVILGGIVGGLVYAMAQEGEITGGGPADPEERKNLEATGWQAYSIKLGDTWYGYKRLQPLSSLIAMAADVAEAKDEDTAKGLYQKYTAAFIDAMVDETYLQGFVGFSQAIGDPFRYGEQFLEKLEGSVVPAIVRRTAHAIDPVVRETDGFGTSVQANLPYLSKGLPEVRRGTGEPLERRQSLGEDTLGGVAKVLPTGGIMQSTVKGSEADLEREFDSIRWVPRGAANSITIHGKQVALSPEDEKLLDDADSRTTAALRKAITDPRFKAMTPEDKEKYFKRRYDAGRDSVRARLRAKYSQRQARLF